MGKVDRVTSLNRATDFLVEIDHSLYDNDVRRTILDEDLQRRLVESVFPQVEDGNGTGPGMEPDTKRYFAKLHDQEVCYVEIDHHLFPGDRSRWVCSDGSFGNGASYQLIDGEHYVPADPFVEAVWKASGFFTGMYGESAGFVSVDHAMGNFARFSDLYADGLWGSTEDEWRSRALAQDDEDTDDMDW